MSELCIAIYVICGAIVLQYLLNPILLRLRHREFAQPKVEKFPVENLPDKAKNFFDATEKDFIAAGFVPCALARLSNPAGNGEVYFLLWFHWSEGISGSASVAFRRMPNQTSKLFSKIVSFVTRYSETTQFETSNSATPTPYSRMQLRPVVKLPSIQAVPELLRAHLALADGFHAGKERLLPEKGEELAMMTRKIAEIYHHQVQAGRWEYDENRLHCRPTWKGATINGWQYSWPVNAIRKWLLRREAERIFASLNRTNG